MTKFIEIFKTTRGILGYILLFFNTIFMSLFMLPAAFIKKNVNNDYIKIYCLALMQGIGKLWIFNNYIIVKLLTNIKINIANKDQTIKLLSTLPKDKWYFIMSNHQSWNDVFILQFIYNRYLPFQKYFVKDKLRKFPLMGYIWDALDNPFLKRKNKINTTYHTTNNIEPNLEINHDLEEIKYRSKKLKLYPCSITSFIEGTRFSTEKNKLSKSPFKYLLKPKAGGMACVLEQLQKEIKGILDTTIVYNPNDKTSFWDLFCGNYQSVTVHIDYREIPEWLSNKHQDKIDFQEYKDDFQNWLYELWHKKDEILISHYSQ